MITYKTYHRIQINQLALRACFVLLLMTPVSFVKSQSTSWNPKEIKDKDSLLTRVSLNHENQLEKYEIDSSLIEIYEARLNYLEFQLDEGFIFYEEGLYAYLNEIKDLIIERNHIESDEIMILVSSSPIPNAFSIGNGVIIFNLGLLHKLKSEAQISFVMSHEIAHFTLDHSNKDIIEGQDQQESDLRKEELDSLLSQKYNRRKLIVDLLEDVFYEQMSYSRSQEIEADSMGFHYYKNTPYSKGEAPELLLLLDSIDQYNVHAPIDYGNIFNYEAYEFNYDWLEKETYMFGGAHLENKWNNDSLKSHPDADIRAEIIKNTLKEDTTFKQNDTHFALDSSYFSFLQENLNIEFISSWIKYENYSRALFHALKLLSVENDNLDYLSKVSEVLDLIHTAYLDNNLSKYIERPSSTQEAEYNDITELIDNLSLSDLQKLLYHYHNKYLSTMKDYDAFQDTYIKYSETNKQ